MKKGYKFRIYPTVEQRVLLARTFGCARLVYNRLLDRSSKAYQAHKTDPQQPKPDVSGYGHGYHLPALKEELPFLNDVSSVALQQATLDLGRAYTNFFKKRGKYPTFKSKLSRQSVRLVGTSFTIKGDLDAPSFYIVKSKSPIRVRWSRALPTSPSSVTISQEPDGKYYASFVCEYQPQPTNGDRVIGLDLGIKAFYHDSDNCTIEPPKYYRRAERRLWQCPSCHSTHDRDENAAINIRQEGWRIYEHESSRGHSLDGHIVLGETRVA